MIQTLIVALLFAGAICYLGNMVLKNFKAKSDCASGCGKCGAADLKKIESQLKEKRI